jgi:hypothetical protein
MGLMEEGRQLIQDFVTPEIRSIEARMSAADMQDDGLEVRKQGPQAKVERLLESLQSKIDRSHTQTMETLRRLEHYIRSQILESLARVESKLQNVA